MAVEGVTSLLTGLGDPSKDIASFIGVAPAPPAAVDSPYPSPSDALPESLDNDAARAQIDAAKANYEPAAKAVPADYHGGPPPSAEDPFADTSAAAPLPVDVDDPLAAREAVSAALDGTTPSVPGPFVGEDDAVHTPTESAHVGGTSLPVSPPPPDPSPSYEDEYDFNDGEDENYALSKPSFGDMLSKPLEFFKKSPKMGRTAAVGAVGLVAAIGAGVMFGGSTASETPVATPPSVVEEAPGLETPSAEVTTLLPKAVSASCPPGSTSPSMAFTNRPENAWVCQRAHGIDGAAMNVVFPKTVVVKSITVMPGWNYVAPNGRDHWNEHRLVTKILWRIGGQQFEQSITPTRSGSTLTLPGNGIATTVMSLTILTTERPDALSADAGGEGGGFLAPGGDTGPENTDVDKSTAIGSVTIMGSEI